MEPKVASHYKVYYILKDSHRVMVMQFRDNVMHYSHLPFKVFTL